MVEKTGQAGALQSPCFADGYRALHEYAELVERFDNRLALCNLRLVERYRQGDLKVVLNGRWDEAIDFRIVLQRTDEFCSYGDTSARADGARAGGRMTEVQPAIRDGHERHVQLGENLDAGRSYRNDALVFIQGVEFMENPQRGIPALVRLQPADQPLGFGANALYFSYGVGFKALTGSADGEAASASYLFSVRDDQITHKLIECGAEIVNGVSDDDAGALWNGFVDAYADDVIASFIVLLHEKFVGLGLKEGADKRLKLGDVFFGPFDF